MSRIKTFVQFNDRQTEDTNEILDQVGITVSVFRTPVGTGSTGFSSEVGTPTLLRNILVYLHPTRSGAHSNRVSSDAGKGSEISYIGITGDKDVRVDDIWKHKGEEYVVESVDNSSVGKMEARLVKKV